ncbi:hypothetical protein Vadar_022997 [Vaccinium darrowii]|uniref:Uncharacterized protein n=1 Tax=Vaccinium darrowii TaxID=229202 RepID=A0ACB7XBW5_9ERIC|nr:hypothetical protein Vadar_022997 [Vaccinium darrowii]
MEDAGEHPLLSPNMVDEYHNLPHSSSQIHDFASYDEEEEDLIGPSSKGIQFFFKEFCVESKKLWHLAGPAILTSVCQYSLGAITQVFAGNLGTSELAMFSVENSIVAGFCYGIMWGMGSALETLCGIAYGAGQVMTKGCKAKAVGWDDDDGFLVREDRAEIERDGGSQNAEISVDASSICANIRGWTINMAGIGLNAAISVRVSNELGASHPRAAKFSAVVVVVTSFLISLFLVLILIVTAKQYPSWFSTDTEVKEIVYELTPLLGISIIVFNVQYSPAGIAGVAIGAGWQAYVAYVNLGCYYLVGIPLCLLMAFKFNMGIEGIWWGIIVGFFLETCIIMWMICRTNWNKEAFIARDRIKQWGGEADDDQS